MFDLIRNVLAIIGGIIVGWFTMILTIGFLTIGFIMLVCIPFIILVNISKGLTP